jgi:FHS family L-fucose permease-like MFS transporter
MSHSTRNPAVAPTTASAGAHTGANTGPLVIVTILFFMWGLLTSLNDVLIPHLKAIYTLSYVQAMLVQFCFFGAYFLVSLPAGALIRRLGYQKGACAGLLVAAIGCALFYPASKSGYGLFLFAFFVLASGITILQVAANPYVTVLGPAATASSRLTLTQAFNSLGTTVAPALGGMLILSGAMLGADRLAAMSTADLAAWRAHEAASVQGPYRWPTATWCWARSEFSCTSAVKSASAASWSIFWATHGLPAWRLPAPPTTSACTGAARWSGGSSALP